MLRRDWVLDTVMSKEPHVELIVWWVLKAWGENPHACNFHCCNCITQGLSGDSYMTWMRLLLSLQEGKFYPQWTCFPSIEITLWNVSISDLRYHLIVLRQTFYLTWFKMYFSRYQVSSYLNLCLRWSKALVKSWSIYSKLLKTYPEVATLSDVSALENDSIPGLFPICCSLPKEWQGSKHLPLTQVSYPDPVWPILWPGMHRLLQINWIEPL